MQYFSKFLEGLMLKYHYNVIKLISKKFRPLKRFNNLDENSEFFESLPMTCIFNFNEYSLFEDYISSDLLIETLRLAKLRSVTRYLGGSPLRSKLSEEVIEVVLDADEADCYNALLFELDAKWTRDTDNKYEYQMWQQWTRIDG
jgi:hypothetical protein